MAGGLAHAASVGPWGEDPKVVPRFAPKEERRAPKVPSGDQIWKELQSERTYERVDGALLVCHLQVGPHVPGSARAVMDVMTFGLSELAHADVTLKLRLRKDPQIVLWGPRKHDASFVSIPSLAIKRGDRLQMSLIDRGIFGDRALGQSSAVWDGRSPLELSTDKWTAACVIADGPEARRRVQPWLDSLDRQLQTIADAKIDRESFDFGRPTRVIDQLESRFKELFTKEGNFRYAAGFLGWGHAEIQTRLTRFGELQRAFDEAAAREVIAIRGEVAHTPFALPDGTRIAISASGKRLSVRVDADHPLDCASLRESIDRIQLIDAQGRGVLAEASLTDQKGHACTLDRPTRALRAPLHGSFAIGQHQVRLLRTPLGDFLRPD